MKNLYYTRIWPDVEHPHLLEVNNVPGDDAPAEHSCYA
jgi:hypothetical protein